MFNCCTKNILQKNSFLSLPLQDKRKGTVNSLSSFSKLLGVSLQQQKFRAILAKPATYQVKHKLHENTNISIHIQ